MKTLPSLLLIAALAPHALVAQTVWRCGPDGRSYSDAPCPHGRMVAVDDSRSPAQQQAAHEVARREHALAQALVQERRQRERSWVGPTIAGIKPVATPLQPAPPAAQTRPNQPKRKPDAAAGTWRSTAPASPRKSG